MMTNKGFTLIEMMVTLVISSFILMAAYSTHIAQQKTYYAQDQVAEMQQIHRAALAITGMELRMAGYDPQVSGLFGITAASAGRVQFTIDLNEDGILDNEEKIDLGLSPTDDANGDGIPDQSTNGVPNPVDIGKQNYSAGNVAGGYQSFGENIQAVEFNYLDATESATAVLGNITTIEVTILARAGKKDATFTNSITYSTPGGQNWGPYNDNYRRRLLTTSIRCRNLGI